MPVCRRVVAEMRRVHRDAEWVAVGVVLDEHWAPLARGIEPATARLVEAGLVAHVRLLPLIAPDERAAVEVACRVLMDAGVPTARNAPRRAILRGPRHAVVATG